MNTKALFIIGPMIERGPSGKRIPTVEMRFICKIIAPHMMKIALRIITAPKRERDLSSCNVKTLTMERFLNVSRKISVSCRKE